MPEGFGGMDVYVCYWDENLWSAPINLSSSINTENNEIIPYYHSEILYFASDKQEGLGGYDLYKSMDNNGIKSNKSW